MIRSFLPIFSCLGILILAGCGGGGGDSISVVDRSITTTGSYKTLQFTGTTNAYFSRGENIPITFTVKNLGSDPIPYHYGGCAEYSAAVKHSGALVATVTVPFGCAANIKEGTFEPGATKTFTLNWDQISQDGTQLNVRPGKYTIDVQLDVYNLGPDQFLTQSGLHYPAPLGPAPLTIYIQ